MSVTTGTLEGEGMARAERDAEVVRALRAGEEHAFVALVEMYHASLVRLASIYVRDHSIAEEVAQDAFAAALTQWPGEGVPGAPDVAQFVASQGGSYVVNPPPAAAARRTRRSGTRQNSSTAGPAPGRRPARGSGRPARGCPAAPGR